MYLALNDLPRSGQAGDLFGSVNSLFSGLAFAGVIVAILLQREELQLQRQELAQTRKELQRSASAQENFEKALRETMYAQTLRDALEILDSDVSVEAAQYLASREVALVSDPPSIWPNDTKNNADLVIRRYDSVGTFVRRKLLPADYLLTNRSASVLSWWTLLRGYVTFVRATRQEPKFGADFEYLANLASAESEAAAPRE
jgi:hypothetical protein